MHKTCSAQSEMTSRPGLQDFGPFGTGELPIEAFLSAPAIPTMAG
jgi:hypothetical protein